MVCIQCGKRTKEQVHALCFMPEISKIEEPSPVQNGIFKKEILAA
jgi:hypothetical protein